MRLLVFTRNNLRAKDLSLLDTFLVPYNIDLPILTEEEEKWRRVIQSTEPGEDIFEVDASFRFVYFFISKNQISPILFNDAIHELFGKKVPILWKNGNEGIIIEMQPENEESISYNQIINILMSDLYVKINFFVGPFNEELTDIHQHFLTLSKDAKTVFGYTNQPVVTYVDAIPILIGKSNKTRIERGNQYVNFTRISR